MADLRSVTWSSGTVGAVQVFFGVVVAFAAAAALQYDVPFAATAGSVIGFVLSAILVVAGVRTFARDLPKAETIPEKDRQLLEYLIKEKSEKPIDEYIRLSSLSRATGTATQLGLSGLPLITVGLTLVFPALAAGFSWYKVMDAAASFFDLTKLTLGAFIGSFVQRNVTGERIVSELARKIDVLPSSTGPTPPSPTEPTPPSPTEPTPPSPTEPTPPSPAGPTRQQSLCTHSPQLVNRHSPQSLWRRSPQLVNRHSPHSLWRRSPQLVNRHSPQSELSRNLGDDSRLKAAYRGGCRARRMPAQVLIAEADAFVALWKDLKLPDGRDRRAARPWTAARHPDRGWACRGPARQSARPG
jgi:hypothetical protein